MADHVAIVLAAGGSRRLGRPKQLLRRDGETLVHRAVRLALGTQPRRLLVVIGAHGEKVRGALQDLACEFVLNPTWEQGLSTSLRAAARGLGRNRSSVLIVGCDQPALDAAHLVELFAAAANAPSGCAATVHGGVLGIPVVVTADVLQSATALEGDRGLGATLSAIEAKRVGRLVAVELGRDLDTEDDVRHAIADGILDR